MSETQDQTRDLTISEAAGESRSLQLAGSRLPYHPALEDRFGIDRGAWKVLTDVTFPAAEGPESIIMALSYCKARNLDIMKKPVHIVPVWDRKRGKLVDSVWPGIAESRVTAMRTGEYVGKGETIFGPEITEKFGDIEVTYPEWAMVTVYRFIKGMPCAFAGEKVRWKEYYAKAGKTVVPNDMWRTKPHSQLSKCAEASALRMAFPEEAPADATAEEMWGQEVDMSPTPESLGPGVMQRLSGQNGGAGFDHAQVQEQTAHAPAARQRKPRAAKASTPPHNPDTGEILEGDDLPASLKGEEVGTIQAIEGPAPAGVVYILSGVPTKDGKRPTFKDGKPFSSATDPSKFPCYDEHAPEISPEVEPEGNDAGVAASPTDSSSSSAGSSPAPDDEQLPPELDGYITAVEAARDFPAVKAALKTLMATQFWKDISNEQANRIRANTWQTMAETAETDGWAIPDPAKDASAFRLWIEAQDDADAVMTMLAALESQPDFASKPDAFKEQIRAAAQGRVDALEE